jgi:WD40 repeat protein
MRELEGGGWLGGGAAFSPDGKLLATSSYTGKVLLWDAATFDSRGSLSNEFSLGTLAFSPDGKVLGAATGFTTAQPKMPRGLVFWELDSRKKLDRLASAAPDAAVVAFSPDGRLVAVGYHTGWVRLWDWETQRNIAEFRKHDGQVAGVAFSADGTLLASGGIGDEHVVVYSVSSRAVLRDLPGHIGGVRAVAFAPDGKTLAVAGEDGTTRLWNLATYQLVLTLKQHAGLVKGIAFTRDGNMLASCTGGGEVRLWPAASPEEINLETP